MLDTGYFTGYGKQQDYILVPVGTGRVNSLLPLGLSISPANLGYSKNKLVSARKTNY